MNNPASKVTTDTLPALNALRGIAALMVCMMHFGDVWQPQVGEWVNQWTGFLDNAYLWVDFFFLLSGFVLTHVYHQSFRDGVRHDSLARFMWARFARIYPLHAAMLLVLLAREVFFTLVYIAKNGMHHWMQVWPAEDMPLTGSFSLVELARHLLLIQSLTYDTQHVSWNFPSWSIGTEWYAYLLLPFIIALLYRPLIASRYAAATWLALIALATALLWQIGKNSPIDLDIAGFLGLARCVVESMLGMATYAIYRRGSASPLLQNSGFLLAVATGILLGMHFNVPDALVIPGFVLLMVGCTHNRTSVNRILESSVLRRLGELSYSIYLIHTPVRILLADAWRIVTRQQIELSFGLAGSFAVWLLGLVIVIGLSTLTYRWIELPAQRWLKQRTPFQTATK